MGGVENLDYFKEIQRREPGAIPLDADRDGRVDLGEGIVIPRCGERFLVVASDHYLEMYHGKLQIPSHHIRVPYAVQIASDDTVISLKAKIGTCSQLGLLDVEGPPPDNRTLAKDLRSHEVFRAFANTIPNALPHVIAQRSFTALYPASGSHIAPLVTFFELIDQGFIEAGKLIMTEVDLTTSDHLKQNLSALKNAGIIEGYEVLERTTYNEEKTSYEDRFVIQYNGKKIKILLAIQMSGGAYYHQVYLLRADAVFLHDVDAGWQGDAWLLSQILRDQPKREQPQVILVENETDTFGDIMGNRDLTFLNHYRLPGAYGHRSFCSSCYTEKETGYPLYRSALLLRPDQPLFAGLNPTQVDLVIRFATLGTSEILGDGRIPADINDQSCYEHPLHGGSSDPKFQIREGELEELMRIVEGWMRLPDDILPPVRKDQIRLHLLFYFYTMSSYYLEGYDYRMGDSEEVEARAHFYQRHQALFAEMSQAAQKHPEEFRQLSPRHQNHLRQFLKGKPPPDDDWDVRKAIQKTLRQLAQRE